LKTQHQKKFEPKEKSSQQVAHAPQLKKAVAL